MEERIFKESDEWITPDEVFEPMEKEFGPFDLDAAANPHNARAKTWFGFQEDGFFHDGLQFTWTNFKNIWCNPPYSKEGKKDEFIRKAFEASLNGTQTVMLLPVKSDTISFHQYLWMKPNVEIRFIKGRIRFLNRWGIRQDVGRFASMWAIFKPIAR